MFYYRMSNEGKPPKFVVKGDDDTYYNIPLIRKDILHKKDW